MNLKKLFEVPKNNHFKILLFILMGLVVALGIFNLGERVGYRRASFSFKNGDNYYRAFEHPNTNRMNTPQFVDANGSAGRIVSITPTSFVVEDRDGTEKSITVGEDTVIRRLRDTVTILDIKIGDHVVVLGTPNVDGNIEATLIRLLPAPEKTKSTY